jgi:hypothetical protein
MVINLSANDVMHFWYNIALSACYSWSIATAKMSFAVLYIRLLPKRLLININKAMVIFCPVKPWRNISSPLSNADLFTQPGGWTQKRLASILGFCGGLL